MARARRRRAPLGRFTAPCRLHFINKPGIPAPVGAGLAFLPVYLWMETGEPLLRNPWLVAGWLVLIAFLMISSIATLSWKSLRPSKDVRLVMIALVGLTFAALLSEPWWTLSAICAVYLALMPLGIVRYARVKRQRRGAVTGAGEQADGHSPAG